MSEDDGSVEVAQLTITSYIHLDGTSTYAVKTKGGAQLTTYIGLAVVAQHELMRLNDNNAGPNVEWQ